MMKLYTAQWIEGGRLGQRTYTTQKTLLEFAREKVQAEHCGPFNIWAYTVTGPVAAALAQSHDRSEWWDKKEYLGTVLKSGTFTKGR
jgi:hypothetical protein